MLFQRNRNLSKKISMSINKQDTDSIKIEKFRELLSKTDPEKIDYYEEKQKSIKLLESISNQTKLAKEEYSKTVAELMPIKWELVEKKSEIEKLRSEYNVILAQLDRAKSELDSINSDSDKPKINVISSWSENAR